MEYLGRNFILGLSAVCFFSSSQTMAESNQFFLNGSSLLNLCGSESLEEQAACEGYIIGVQDSIFSGHLQGYVNICFPKGVGTRQLRLNFIEHAKKNPSILHFAAEGLVAQSIAELFACKTGNEQKGFPNSNMSTSSLGCNSLLEKC